MAVDTHRIAQRLRRGGAFSETQTSAIVEGVTDLASPLATNQELELQLAGLRLEIAKSHKQLVMWVAGFGGLILATQLATVIAVLTQS